MPEVVRAVCSCRPEAADVRRGVPGAAARPARPATTVAGRAERARGRARATAASARRAAREGDGPASGTGARSGRLSRAGFGRHQLGIAPESAAIRGQGFRPVTRRLPSLGAQDPRGSGAIRGQAWDRKPGGTVTVTRRLIVLSPRHDWGFSLNSGQTVTLRHRDQDRVVVFGGHAADGPRGAHRRAVRFR